MDPFVLLLATSCSVLTVIYGSMKLADHFHVAEPEFSYKKPLDYQKTVRNVALHDVHPRHFSSYQ